MTFRRSHPWLAARTTITPTHQTHPAETSPRSSGVTRPRGARLGHSTRTRRGGERTGPIARTRRHGDPTGQTPVVRPVPIDEPHIDPYDFGFDDVGYGPHSRADTRIDATERTARRIERRPPAGVRRADRARRTSCRTPRRPDLEVGRPARARCGRPAAPSTRCDRVDRCTARSPCNGATARVEQGHRAHRDHGRTVDRARGVRRCARGGGSVSRR